MNLIRTAVVVLGPIVFAPWATAQNWQYTDASHTVVSRTNADGSVSTISVNDPAVRTWIDAGHTPAAELHRRPPKSLRRRRPRATPPSWPA